MHKLNKSVIVYGPPGCGKTTNAQRIATALGLTKIHDNWDPLDRQLAPFNTLHLTNSSGPWPPHVRRVARYADVMQQIEAGRPLDITDLATTSRPRCRSCEEEGKGLDANRLCSDCEAMAPAYQKFDALIAEGHSRHQAFLMSGLAAHYF
ncbi:AAA family ATPase [Pseudomonas citronellolis]|uniref:AAA family ATPase n=1 Tax=Pseudomonas citronellolis TaxID=53408 RepID=A0AAW6P8P4_9PSED|nr:AAA family ATPase [Pseudomonas citronellolis]MDF3842696.1 AAA family ATPase [Pseudomonas citronellolis]